MRNLISSIMLVLMLFTAQTAIAQGKGNLQGVIRDKAGEVLPGAAVVVKGTTLGTATDLNGKYMLQGISAGQTTIEVNYLGYNTVTRNVSIKDGQTAECDVVLEESAYALKDVVISAVAGGQQRALNQQKMASNMTQVISADQMGRFPDPNVADALKRLSGVTTNGTEVQLRGTPASFTNININGEQVMSSQEGGKRNEQLDLLPSDILASLEVQKTLLPSNDGDAIAGVINMRTATARSLKPKFTLELGSGYNAIREQPLYNLKAGYQQRFFKTDRNDNGVLGIAFNYSFLRSNKGYDRLEAQAWEDFTLTDNETGDVVDDKAYIPTDFRYRYQERKETRHGVSFAIDWQPTKVTKFTLSTIYNQREDDDTRYRNRFRFRDNGNGFLLMKDGSIGAERARNIAQVSGQSEMIRNLSINLDGETTLGTWKLDGGVFFNKTKRDYFSTMANFQTPDYRAGKKPTGYPDKLPKKGALAVIPDIHSKYLSMDYLLKYPNGSSFGDISRYNLYMIERENFMTEGENVTARFNASKNFFINDYASTLSFGIKGKFMNNEGYVPDGVWSHEFEADDANNMANLLYKPQLDNKFLGNHIRFGVAPSLAKVQNYFNSLGNTDQLINYYVSDMNKESFTYDARENVYSAYLMDKVQFNKLMVLAGVRMEYTDVKYTANKVEPYYDPNVSENEDGNFNTFDCTPVKASVNYVKFLPNVQFKYDMTDKTIFRLAWTTGYSRPNIMDLVPKTNVTQDVERVQLGNPDLKPAYSHNVDLLFEQYLSNVGLISGGFFYKHIANFQYLSEGIQDGGRYDGWQVIKSMNGDAAKVYGAEVTLNSTLSFLPGFLKNLVFTGNYTFTHSKATTNVERGMTRLPGQAKHTGNLALAYSTKRFTLQASANYIGSFITALGTDAERDMWENGRWQLDLNGSVQLCKGLTMWAEVTDVTNSERYTYFGNKDRLYNLQLNGVNTRAGFTYRF